MIEIIPYAIYCYAQNDYIAQELLPEGHYQIASAKVLGDTGNYPLVYDKAEFDITQTGTAEIQIQRAKNTGTISPTIPDTRK